MDPTVIRGLSDAYGSWKTIWQRRRICASSLPFVWVRDCPVEEHLTGGGRDQVEQHAPGGGLAATGLADEAERLAPVDLEGHAGHRRHVADGAAEHAAADREVLDEVGCSQQGLRARRCGGGRLGVDLGHAPASPDSVSALTRPGSAAARPDSVTTSSISAATSSVTSAVVRSESTVTPSSVSA